MTPAGLKKVFDEADRQFESLPEWKRSGSAQFLAPKRIETERIRVSSTKTDPVKQLTPHTSRSCETCEWLRDTKYIKGGCFDPDNDCSGFPDYSHWKQKQLTSAEEEAYVRGRWERVHVKDDQEMEESEDIWFRIWIGPDKGDVLFDCGAPTKEEVIHKAYLFTERREAEIADIVDEITSLRSIAYSTNVISASVCERIIAREQAVLAELRRGWKEQG